MAIAEKSLARDFGTELVDHRTYVFVGDGCLMEGIGQEVISLAGHLGLGKLIVLYDDNSITIDGPTDISFSEDIPARFKSCGWHVVSADGHDSEAIDNAISEAKDNQKQPSLVALKTIIGFGSPNKSGKSSSHGSPLGPDEVVATKAALGWSSAPFEIPTELREKWLKIDARNATLHTELKARYEATEVLKRNEFDRRVSGVIPADFDTIIGQAKQLLIDVPQKVATRKASQMALETITQKLPEMIGGSADLTGSNLTRVAAVDSQFTKDVAGRYIGYGVREFAMAAAMNGMSLHGGIIPYGGTFLVFSDYARNAIRLSALMGIGTVYVMTHDSIGLGEDRPTHQPVEHLALSQSLRSVHFDFVIDI